MFPNDLAFRAPVYNLQQSSQFTERVVEKVMAIPPQNRKCNLPWWVAVVAGLVLWPATNVLASPLEFVPWRADHHMHLRSQAVYEATAALCSVFGKQACSLPDAQHAVLGAADAVAALDEAHVGNGVVLSMAYLFGSPYLSTQ